MEADELVNDENNPDSTDETSLEEVAYHEAGHAVIGFLNKLPIKKVSIVPDELEGSLGHVENFPTYGKEIDLETQTYKYYRSSPYEYSDKKMMKEIMSCLAGDIAGNILKKQADINLIDLSTPDHQQAINFALESTGTSDEASALLAYLWHKTCNTLLKEETWFLVKALANELLEKKEISGKHTKEFLRAKRAELYSSLI